MSKLTLESLQKAFDLIIERLKEVGQLEIQMHGGRCNEKTLTLGYKKGIENAIEIVNQVAEEYKSTEHISCSTEEVCEWVEKSVDSIKLVREPHRLRLFHIEEERQYCPYCGKKIKVV